MEATEKGKRQMRRSTAVFTAGMLALGIVATGAGAATASVKAPTELLKTPSVKVSASGGKVTLVAVVSNGVKCTLSSNPIVKGWDRSFLCHDATVKRTAVIPANTGAARNFVLWLAVRGDAQMIRRGETVHQAGASAVAPSPTTRTVPTSVSPTYVTPMGGGGSGGGGSTTPPVTTPPTTTPPTVTHVRAGLDPTYVLDATSPQAPPIEATFTYSASTGTTVVPDGDLSLVIQSNAHVSGSYTCTDNIQGATTTTVTATCKVQIPAWGLYQLVTAYSSGVGNVAATGETEVVSIEPPALAPTTINAAWGTTAPTQNLAASAIVAIGGKSAVVTVTDASFEGAGAVTVTDQAGDECGATVTNGQGTCTLALTAPLTGLTIGYPGGTSTTLTESASPWGVPEPQQVTTTWPADSAAVTPTVTTLTSTDVTVPITQINAFLINPSPTTPAPCVAGTRCAAVGVEGLPPFGVVTISDSSTGTTEGCTINLATASICYMMDPFLNGQARYPNWKISASWSGYSTTDAAGNVVTYSAPPVEFTLQAQPDGAALPPTGYNPTGMWWEYEGNANTTL